MTERTEDRPIGTLGGGCVEADAIAAGRETITTGRSSLRAYELNEQLAWNTGLVCGGTMWILVEPGGEAAGDAHQPAAIEAALCGGSPVAWVTRLRREDRGLSFAGKTFVEADGRSQGTFGSTDLDRAAVRAALE